MPFCWNKRYSRGRLIELRPSSEGPSGIRWGPTRDDFRFKPASALSFLFPLSLFAMSNRNVSTKYASQRDESTHLAVHGIVVTSPSAGRCGPAFAIPAAIRDGYGDSLRVDGMFSRFSPLPDVEARTVAYGIIKC